MTTTVTGGEDSILTDSNFVVVEHISTPVSSSGFEGGPSDHEASATPGDMVSTTPSTPPVTGAAHLCGKSMFLTPPAFPIETREISTQTVAHCVECFSSKTCLELLQSNKLSVEQLEHELKYLNLLGCDLIVKPLSARFRSAAMMRTFTNHLSTQSCVDFSETVKIYDSVIHSFSRLVEEAQSEIDRLREPTRPPTPPVTSPHHVTNRYD